MSRLGGCMSNVRLFEGTESDRKRILKYLQGKLTTIKNCPFEWVLCFLKKLLVNFTQDQRPVCMNIQTYKKEFDYNLLAVITYGRNIPSNLLLPFFEQPRVLQEFQEVYPDIGQYWLGNATSVMKTFYHAKKQKKCIWRKWKWYIRHRLTQIHQFFLQSYYKSLKYARKRLPFAILVSQIFHQRVFCIGFLEAS